MRHNPERHRALAKSRWEGPVLVAELPADEAPQRQPYTVPLPSFGGRSYRYDPGTRCLIIDGKCQPPRPDP